MNKKGIAALGLSLMMAGTMLTGCGSGDSDGAGKKADAKGSVYYLNFKPEIGRSLLRYTQKRLALM